MSGVLAFIPARLGSKGVPGKNTRRLLCGKPLYQWALESVLGIREVTEVIVSTDDPKALSECPFGEERPASISGDKTQIEELLHYHLALRTNHPNAILVLQPSSPLRTRDDVDGAITKFFDEEADSLVSVVKRHSPFFWTQRGQEWIKPYASRPNRQDMTPTWQENGAIYICKTRALLASGDRVTGKIVTYEMGPEHRYEIDDETDWQVVESLMRQRIDKETPAWR